MDSIFQDFANAIVMQAVKDYRAAALRLRRQPRHEPSLSRIREVEGFFRSGWFSCLTRLDPETLITRLNMEAKA